MNSIVLDFETTGPNPQYAMPVQAAYAVYTPVGEEIEATSFLVNPGLPIGEGAFAVHGISDEKAQKEGISLNSFAAKWHQVVWKYQPINLLGYNIINFDLIILQRLLGLHTKGKFKYPPIEKVVDVMFLAQRFFQTRRWLKLVESVNRAGIPHNPDNFHEALVDVRFTWKLYDKLINRR